MITTRVKVSIKYSRRIFGIEQVSFELSFKGQKYKMKRRNRTIKAQGTASAKV